MDHSHPHGEEELGVESCDSFVGEIGPFKGEDPHGCHSQVVRASGGSVDLYSLVLKESEVKVPEVVGGTSPSSCGLLCCCRVSENGCLDPSLCFTAHLLSDIPNITRWCDDTTRNIQGAGYLVFWSGWARPSVMKLLGRWPTVGAVLGLLVDRTESCVSHKRMKFGVLRGHLSLDGVELLYPYYSPQGGTRAKNLLLELPENSRFSYHL